MFELAVVVFKNSRPVTLKDMKRTQNRVQVVHIKHKDMDFKWAKFLF